MATRFSHGSGRLMRFVPPTDANRSGIRGARLYRCSAFYLQESSNASKATPPAEFPSRRDRNAQAASAISSLQIRRVHAEDKVPVRGSFRTGIRTSQNDQRAQVPPSDKLLQPRRPLTPRRPGTDAGHQAADAAPPPGTMIRAPSKLRIRRNAPGGQRRGPNLQGRRGGPGGKSGGSGSGPQKRTKGGKDAGINVTRVEEDMTVDETLSDGMVQHLLRLQRQEWDRVPYEPKYAPGSFAASELIHAGRELFRGESPPVKFWGPLETKLRVVGMHGAEARLQIKRVPHGDSAPFGQEEEGESAADVQQTASQ